MGDALTRLRRRPFTASLVAVGAAMVVSPAAGLHAIGHLLFFLALVLAIHGTSVRPWVRRATVAYAAVAAVAYTGNIVAGRPIAEPVMFLADCALSAFVPIVVIRHVLAQNQTTSDELAGALVSYVLIGVFFGYAHALIDASVPGSYAGMGPSLDSVGRSQYIYFSFTTLTTLGYGDIAPHTPLAQGMSILEATLGQAYLAVLIAHLVGRRTPAPPAAALEDNSGPG